MTQRVDSEVILRRWFEQGPSTMPDRVVSAVADRIARVPQRRGWTRPFASPAARRTLRWMALAAAVAALIIAGLWAIGQTPRQVVIPSLPPAPTTPVRATQAAPRTLSADGFAVPFSVTLVDRWSAPDVVPARVFLSRGVLNIAIAAISATRVRPAGTEATSFDAMEPWPSDVYAWLQTLPRCEPEAPRSTTVGGQQALVVDYRCVGLKTSNVEQKVAATSVFAFAGGGFDQYGVEGTVNRIIEIRTAPNGGIAVLFTAPQSTFESDAAAVDALLARLRFE